MGEFEGLESGELSDLAELLIKEALADGDLERYKNPFYGGRETKRIGFAVTPSLKFELKEAAGWRQMAIVMSNLFRGYWRDKDVKQSEKTN